MTPTPAPDATWYRDVQPIVRENCTACHTEGGIAPFSLETYEAAALWSSAMAAAVKDGSMPPWMPADDCQSFQDARVLTSEAIDVIDAWDMAGAPGGDPADETSDPAPVEELPWVDATLDAGADYTPDGTESDDYHCFVFDPELAEDEFVIGFQVLPEASHLVHHVLLYETDPGEAAGLDDAEAGVGWTCYGGPGTSWAEAVGGWAPGTPATPYPKDTGIALQASSILVMQIHYNLDHAEPEPDRTSVQLQYSTSPVLHPASILGLFNTGFSIPPYAEDYTSTITYQLGSSITLWGAFPHMHQLGDNIRVSYSRSGQEQCLIDIPAWDFHWQQFYFYDALQGLSLQPNDVLSLRCVWDNPTDQTVIWGEGTSDEMCINYFYVTY